MSDTSEKITLLHVDDEPDFAEVVGNFLEREDDRFEVETATNGSEALDRLDTVAVDCVVSDYDMPGMNGIEFLEAVRAEYGDLPFVLFTGKGSEDIASEAIAAGVNDYLQKSAGTEQYTILANRIRNAVEQHRATLRAAALERVRNVLRDVNQTLVRANDRDEIERQVCEIVSAAEPYLFAWIGEHDDASRVVEPRVAAGVEEGYLEEVEITVDESEKGQGPTGRAVRNRELTVNQDIESACGYEPWRTGALERGYRSSAAIPLLYGETMYGVLNVYADRPGAFDERERELLTELSQDVAHAIYRTGVRSRLERDERILQNLPVGVYRATAGPEGELIDANPALAEIFGAESTETLEEYRVSDFYRDPEDRAEVCRRLRKEGVVRDVELPQVTLDGEEIWVAVTAIRTGEDGETFFVGVIRDVTERRRIEQELREREAHLRQAQSIANLGSWSLDLQNDRLLWSDGVYRIFGLDPDEPVSYETFLEHVHPEDRDRVDDRWSAALEGAPYDIEHRIVVDEAVKWVREKAEIEFDENGQPVSGFGVVQDVTDRRERDR